MKQIFQNLKNGNVDLSELPVPVVKPGHVLIQTKYSLISLGTEKMLLNFGKANWISKARQQPDKVIMVLNKIKTDGLNSTIHTVLNKLSTPMPLGYSNAGVVIGVGRGVTQFKIGDRVISNGAHAEIVNVSKNLCAKIPDSVTDQDAAFTVVSAIALQGIRLVNPTLGETVVVIGLGLIGLITVQLLKANGCRVIGFDMDPMKVDLAKQFGADAYQSVDPQESVDLVESLTNQVGADAVIITASTPSNGPIDSAPRMCRIKGRVVLVGVIGLNLNRTEFFKKEISFQVSCSYGPGRYDKNYEDRGEDYPLGHVRWTEQRNFQAILDLISRRQLNFEKLTSQISEFNSAPSLYGNLSNSSQMLGILLKYSDSVEHAIKEIELNSPTNKNQKVVLGFIGAGNFTSSVLVPSFSKTSCRLKSISSSTGLSSNELGKKFNFEKNISDYKIILNDNELNTVVISTPHSSHGSLVLETLNAGKNVFVEKPLAISLEEIEKIERFYEVTHNPPKLMVGFNRRFSPLTKIIKKHLEKQSGPKAMVFTVNSGFIPQDHWTQDKLGGGRLIGEGCHFIDFVRYIADSEIKDFDVVYANFETKDTYSISLNFEDGSIATIHYFSNGNKGYQKEKFELFVNKHIFLLDNFKKLTIFNQNGKKTTHRLWNQDKGHFNEISSFVDSIENGKIQPIALKEIFEISKVSIKLAQK